MAGTCLWFFEFSFFAFKTWLESAHGMLCRCPSLLFSDSDKTSGFGVAAPPTMMAHATPSKSTLRFGNVVALVETHVVEAFQYIRDVIELLSVSPLHPSSFV